MLSLLLALALAVAPGCNVVSPPENSALKTEFRKTHACPATGKTTGACPGYEISHMIPRCCIGTAADVQENLTWVTVKWHDEIHRRTICKPLVP
jgi:hypothetical protein